LKFIQQLYEKLPVPCTTRAVAAAVNYNTTHVQPQTTEAWSSLGRVLFSKTTKAEWLASPGKPRENDQLLHGVLSKASWRKVLSTTNVLFATSWQTAANAPIPVCIRFGGSQLKQSAAW